MLLARPPGVAAALTEQGEHVLLGVSGDRAELGGRGDVEVEVAVELVGGALVAQAPDQLGDLVDHLGDPDVLARREDPQRLHVGPEQLDLALGQLPPVLPGLLGTLQQRVVDVGGVLGEVNLVAGVPPDPADQVEGEVGVGVAQMGGVVGVMPQTYIRAVEPGWVGTTSPAAVSNSRSGVPAPGSRGTFGADHDLM
nr:hypothetical protein GCM10020093_027210 [Planobispora longispora]